ncbi:MAG: hypothetical protein ABIE94_05890 [archaeon]
MQGAWYTLKRHGTFTKSEQVQFFVTCLFIALGFFLHWWRTHDISFGLGILWFILFFIFAVIFLGIYVWAQKLKGAQMGYKVSYGYWIPGLLIGFLINVASSGLLIVFVPGTVDAMLIDRLKIGKFRGRFNFMHLLVLSVWGLLASFIIVIILKPIYFATGGAPGSFMYSLILMTILIGLYSLIPYPHSIGMNMFRTMRWSVIWAAAMGVAYALLIVLSNTFSFILAFIIGLVVLIIWHTFIETKKTWA